ncbi:MAG: hypothetical protein AAF998_19895 [Bacteroidota bacterium]
MASTTQVEFSSSHRPQLPAGEYTLNISPSLSVAGDNKSVDIPVTLSQEFAVAGERFALNPTEIDSVFPPAGSIGDHSNVLPHIVLKRSTLPWERSANPNEDDSVAQPWLALLVFDETAEEVPEIKTISVAQLQSPDPNEPRADGTGLQGEAGAFPRVIDLDAATSAGTGILKLEAGQRLEQKIQVIDVPSSLLANILPNLSDLEWGTHVRQTVGTTEADTSEEFAVVIANRFPSRGGRSVVHLVALENHYENSGFYQALSGSEAPSSIRLVSLYHWSFSCLEAYKISEGSIKVIETEIELTSGQKTALLDLGEVSGTTTYLAALDNILGGTIVSNFQNLLLQAAVHETFLGLLTHLDRAPSTLRLPTPANLPSAAQAYLDLGSVALPHRFRNGDTLPSWYHGPLVSSAYTIEESAVASLNFPVLTSDELLLYNSGIGMFDVSYAAAWELGRILALRDKRFSRSLYNWKKGFSQSSKSELLEVVDYLPFKTRTADSVADVPSDIADWFADLATLANLPFNYLVPDEKLLPAESIRFFQLDPYWMEALFDGAFSIGRANSTDTRHETTLRSALTSQSSVLSGFLLRSDLVSGWPDLQIEGYDTVIDTDDNTYDHLKQAPYRTVRLSDSVLLVLFEFEVKTVDIHQKPEKLHFGFDEIGEGNFRKSLKTPDGLELTDGEGDAVYFSLNDNRTNSFRNETERAVSFHLVALQIQETLHSNGVPIDSFSSAEFCIQLLEGASRVRFRFG